MNKSFYYNNAESLGKIQQDLLFLDTVKDPLKNPYSVAATEKAQPEEDILTKGEREAYLISNYAKRGYVPTKEGHDAYEAYRKATDPNGWAILWDSAKHAAGTVIGGAYDMVASGDILNPITTAGTLAEGTGRGTRYFTSMVDTIKYDPSNPINRYLFSQGNSDQRYADFQKGLAFQRETGEIEENGYWVPKKDWDIEGWKVKSYNEQGVAAAEMFLDPSILAPELKIGQFFAKSMIGHTIASAATRVAVKGASIAEKVAMGTEKTMGQLSRTAMGLFEYPAQKLADFSGVETLTTSSGKIIAKDSIVRSSSMALGGAAYMTQIPFLSPVAGVWLGSKVMEIGAKTVAEAMAHSKASSYLTIADRLAYQSTDPAVRAIGGMAMRMNGFTDWATQGVKSTFHGSMYGGAFGFAMGGEEGFYSGVGTGIGLAGSFHMLGGAYGIVGNRTERQIANAQKHFAYVAEGFDEAKRVGVNRLLQNIEDVYGQEKMFRTMANIAATERLNKNGRNLILTTEQIRTLLGESPEWSEYQKLMKDPQFGGYTTRRSDTGEIVTLINADYAAHSAVTGELFHSALLQRYGQSMKENIVKNMLGTVDSDGFLYKMSPDARIKLLEDFRDGYLELDASTGDASQRQMLPIFNDAIERVRKGERPETLYPIFEEFAEAYFNRWVEDKPIDYLLKGNSPLEAVFDGAKKMVRGLISGDADQIGGRIQFKSGQPEGFFLNSKGKRVVIPEMDRAMAMLVREMKRDPDALEGFPLRDNANPHHIMLKEAEHLFTRDESGKMVLKSEEQIDKENTKAFSGLLAAHQRLKPEEKGLRFISVREGGEKIEGSYAGKSKKVAELEAEAKAVEKAIKQRKARLLGEAAKIAKLTEKQKRELVKKRDLETYDEVEALKEASEVEGIAEYRIEGYMTDKEAELFTEYLPKYVVQKMLKLNRVIHQKGADGNNVLRFDYKGKDEQKFKFTQESGRNTGAGNERHQGKVKTRDVIPYEMVLKFERKKLTKALREEYEIDDKDIKYLVGKPVLIVEGIDMYALDRRVRYAFNHMRRHDSPRSISSATVKMHYESEEEIHHDIKRLFANYSLGDHAMAGADFFGGGAEGRAKRDIINGIIGARPNKGMDPATMQEKGFHYPPDLQQVGGQKKSEGGPLNEAFMVFSRFRVDRILDQPKHLHGEGFYYNHKNAHPLNKGNFAPASKSLRDHTGRVLSQSERLLQDETTFKSPSGEPYRLFTSENEDGVHYAWFDEEGAKATHKDHTQGYLTLKADEVLDLIGTEVQSVKELDKDFMRSISDMGYKAVVIRTADQNRVVAFTDFQNFRQTDVSAADFITGNFAGRSRSIAERTRERLGLTSGGVPAPSAGKPMTMAERTRARLGLKEPVLKPVMDPKVFQVHKDKTEAHFRALTIFEVFKSGIKKGAGLSFFNQETELLKAHPSFKHFQGLVSKLNPEVRKQTNALLLEMADEYYRINTERQNAVVLPERVAERNASKKIDEVMELMNKEGLTNEQKKNDPRYKKAFSDWNTANEAVKVAESKVDKRDPFKAVYEKYEKLRDTLANEQEDYVNSTRRATDVNEDVPTAEIKVEVGKDITTEIASKTFTPEQQARINRSMAQRKGLLDDRQFWIDVRKETATVRDGFVKQMAQFPEFKGWTEAEIYRSTYNSIFGKDASVSITKGGKVSFGVIQSLSPSEYHSYRERGVLPRDIKQRTVADIDLALLENWKRSHALKKGLEKVRADQKLSRDRRTKAEERYNKELEAVRNELIQMLASYKLFDVADEVLGAVEGTSKKWVEEKKMMSGEEAGWTPARKIDPNKTPKSYEISRDNSITFELLSEMYPELGRTDPLTVQEALSNPKINALRQQMGLNAFKDTLEFFNKYNLEEHSKLKRSAQEDLALYIKEKEKIDYEIKAAESRSKKFDTTELRAKSNELASKILKKQGEKDPIIDRWTKQDFIEKAVFEILQLEPDQRGELIESVRAQLAEGDGKLVGVFDETLVRNGVKAPKEAEGKVTTQRDVADPNTRTIDPNDNGSKYRDAMDEAYRVLQTSIKKDGVRTPLQKYAVLMQSLARNYKKNNKNPAIKQKLAQLEQMFKETEQVTDVRLKAAYAKMLDYGFVSMSWSGDDNHQTLPATGHYTKMVPSTPKKIGNDFNKLKETKGIKFVKQKVVFRSSDTTKVSNLELQKAVETARKRFSHLFEDETDDFIVTAASKDGGMRGIAVDRTIEGGPTNFYLTGEAKTIRKWIEFQKMRDGQEEATDARVVYIDREPKYVLARGLDSNEVLYIPYDEMMMDGSEKTLKAIQNKTIWWSRDSVVEGSSKYRKFSSLDQLLDEVKHFEVIREATHGDSVKQYGAYKANGFHINGKFFKTMEEAKRLATIDAQDSHAYELVFQTASRLDKDAYVAALAMIQSSTGIQYTEALKEATGFQQVKKTFIDNPNYNPNMPSGKGFNQRKIPQTYNVSGSTRPTEFKKLAVYRAGNLLLVTSDNMRDVLTRLEPESKVPTKGGRAKNIEAIARESQGEFNRSKKAIGDLYRLVKDDNGEMAGVEWVKHYDNPSQVSEMLAKMNDAEFIDIDTTLDFHTRLTKQMKGLLSANFMKEKRKIWEVLSKNPDKISKIKARLREIDGIYEQALIERGLKNADKKTISREITRLNEAINSNTDSFEQHMLYLATEGVLTNHKETVDLLVGEGKPFDTFEELQQAEQDVFDARKPLIGELKTKNEQHQSGRVISQSEIMSAVDELNRLHANSQKHLETLDIITGDGLGFADEKLALEREEKFLNRQLWAAKGGSDKVLSSVDAFEIADKGTGSNKTTKVMSKQELRDYQKETRRIEKNVPKREEDVPLGTVEQMMAESIGVGNKENGDKTPRYLPRSEAALDKFGNPTEEFAEKESFVSTREYLRRFRLLLSDLADTHKKFGDPTSLDKLDLKTILETDASLLPIKDSDGSLSREEVIRKMAESVTNGEEFIASYLQTPEAKKFKETVDFLSIAEKDYIEALSENRITAALMAAIDGSDRVQRANSGAMKIEEQYKPLFATRRANIDTAFLKLPEDLKPEYMKYVVALKERMDAFRASELERVQAELATITEVAKEFGFTDPNSKTSGLIKLWQEQGFKTDPLKQFKNGSRESQIFPSVFSEFHPSPEERKSAESYTKYESRQTQTRVADSSEQGFRYGSNVGGFTTTNPIVAEVIRAEDVRQKFLGLRGVREIDLFGAALARKGQIENAIQQGGTASPIKIDAEGYALMKAYFPDTIKDLQLEITAKFGAEEKLAAAGYARQVRDAKAKTDMQLHGTMLDKTFALFLGELAVKDDVIQHAVAVIGSKERLAELMRPENLKPDGKIDLSKLNLEELDFAFHLLGQVNDPQYRRRVSVTELVENPLYRESMLEAFSRNNGENLQSKFGDDWETAARFLAHGTKGKVQMVNDIVSKLEFDRTEGRARQAAENKAVIEASTTEKFKRDALAKVSKDALEATKALFLELAQTDVAIKSFKRNVEGFWNSRPQARDNVLSIDDGLKLLAPNNEYGNAVIGSDGKTLMVPVADPKEALFRTPNGMFHAFKQGSSYKLFFAGYKSADGLVDLKASHIMTAPDLQRLQVGIRMYHDDIKRVELMAKSQNAPASLTGNEVASFTGSFLETHGNALSPEAYKMLESNLAEIGRYPDTTWLGNEETGNKRQIVIYPNSETWNRLHDSGEYIKSKGVWYKDPRIAVAQERLSRAKLELASQDIGPTITQEVKPSDILAGTPAVTRHSRPENDTRSASISSKTTMSVIEEGPIFHGKGADPVMNDWTALSNAEGYVILREQNRTASGWKTEFRVFFPSGLLAGIESTEEDAVSRMFDE